MHNVLRMLKGLKRHGLIEDYALYGATAVAMYEEAISTMDVDVMVAVSGNAIVVDMTPIYAYCRKQGYKIKGHHVIIDGIPVDIMVVPEHGLLAEAFASAADKKTGNGEETIRVFTKEHLIAIALSVGRAKDLYKVQMLSKCKEPSAKLRDVLTRYSLLGRYYAYCEAQKAFSR